MRLWCLILGICLLLCGCGGGREEAVSGTVEVRRLVPDEEPTHEEIAQGARDLCLSVQDSCARMTEEAQAAGAEAQQLAEEVRAAHGERIAALAALDYDALADGEIYSCMEELSELITVFREARDAIGEMG